MLRLALPLTLLIGGLAGCGQQEMPPPPVTESAPAPAMEAVPAPEAQAAPAPEEAPTPPAAMPEPSKPAAMPTTAPKASTSTAAVPAPTAKSVEATKAVDTASHPVATATAGLDAAKAKYAALCANCHGKTGAGMGNFPKVAGQSADALAAKLKQYRSGEKIGPASASMFPFAKPLSDQDIAQLAAYMASL